MEEAIGEAGGKAGDNLRAHVRTRILRRDLVTPAEQDGTRDGGVEMGTRDVAQCVDHAHQRGGNGICARRGISEHVEADREHQEEGAQELADELGDQRRLPPELVRPHQLEHHGGEGSPDQLKGNVGEAVAEADKCTGGVNGEGDGRVEAASPDGRSSVSAGHDHEANGKTVVLGLLGHRHVQDNEAKHEGVQQLGDANLQNAEALRRGQVKGVPEEPCVAEACDHAGSELRAAVDAAGLPVHATWAAQGVRYGEAQGNSRVEVGAGDASECVDRHHQHAGDGDGTPDSRAPQHVAAHREDEQERADELAQALGQHRRLARHRSLPSGRCR
mmetsp:Transcript_35054/g.90047  ORF Transcript_35054/g.90047 Transcript_35054/m.90047 type:complete len:331 (-) Transcript_35054:83-1075(-)